MAGSDSSVQGWAESDQGIAAINQQQRGIQASYLRENEFYIQFFSDSLISWCLQLDLEYGEMMSLSNSL